MIETLNSIYEKTILARPVVTLFFLSLILIVFSAGLRDFKIDASTDALLLESDKDLRSFREMSMRYKTREFMFIAVAPTTDILSEENIDFVKRLRDELAGVERKGDGEISLVQHLVSGLESWIWRHGPRVGPG